MGRAPRIKETLPDFREWCRVTRHSRVFRGLMGCQRTPGFWGVTIVVGTYRLLLETGHQMDLLNTFYVPSITRDLVSLSKLYATGYFVLFSSGQLCLMLNSVTVGSGILCDGLYTISLNHEFAQALITLH